jgi:hypothetical protein
MGGFTWGGGGLGARAGCSEVVVVRYCSELQFSSSQ